MFPKLLLLCIVGIVRPNLASADHDVPINTEEDFHNAIPIDAKGDIGNAIPIDTEGDFDDDIEEHFINDMRINVDNLYDIPTDDVTLINPAEIQHGSEYMIAIDRAIGIINDHNHYTPMKQALVQVISAKEQQFSGAFYSFVVQIADTNCLKGMDYDEFAYDCVVQPPFDISNPSLNTCVIKAWEPGHQVSKIRIKLIDCTMPIDYLGEPGVEYY